MTIWMPGLRAPSFWGPEEPLHRHQETSFLCYMQEPLCRGAGEPHSYWVPKAHECFSSPWYNNSLYVIAILIELTKLIFLNCFSCHKRFTSLAPQQVKDDKNAKLPMRTILTLDELKVSIDCVRYLFESGHFLMCVDDLFVQFWNRIVQ